MVIQFILFSFHFVAFDYQLARTVLHVLLNCLSDTWLCFYVE